MNSAGNEKVGSNDGFEVFHVHLLLAVLLNMNHIARSGTIRQESGIVIRKGTDYAHAHADLPILMLNDIIWMHKQCS